MACEAIHTGARFLSASLESLDCHGRSIGTYGYGALADLGSVAGTVVTGLLALFIALWGVRLLTGTEPRAQDLMGSAIKIGLFLTLATSWPAWRVIGYDLVLDGPSEVAQTVGLAAGLPGASNDLSTRLQEADNAIVTLTMYGTGRLSNAITRSGEPGDSMMGAAVPDQSTLGIARSLFLISTIGTYALARLGAGLLLAIAPLMAGLLLFSGTSAVFTGWLRALGFCAAASLVFQVAAGAELAMLNPWISEVLELRQANVLAASAPIELLALTGAFALALAGTLTLMARMAFTPGFGTFAHTFADFGQTARGLTPIALPSSRLAASAPVDRAALIVGAIENTARRESPALALQGASAGERANRAAPPSDSGQTRATDAASRQGDRFRRTNLRTSQAARRRDRT